jgi:hypothetical protein
MPEALARAVDQALTMARPTVAVALDGAERSADLLGSLAADAGRT